MQKVATGYTGRRPIVEDARCNKCHQELGTFTDDAFHAGQRNDGTTCAWCHNPNRTSSGWSADSTSFIHAIHGGAKRGRMPFTWHASSTTESLLRRQVPGRAEATARPATCRAPMTSAPARRTARCRIACTARWRPASSTHARSDDRVHGHAVDHCLRRVGVLRVAVLSTTAAASPATAVGYGVSDAACHGATTLVNSPIATQCFACHDSSLERAHMEITGNASIYSPRSAALGKRRDLHGLPRPRAHRRHQGDACEVASSHLR